MGKDMDVLTTPEGELPVASLSTLLSLHLGLDLTPTESERALVAIRSGNQVATIRVGQVSRPIDIASEHWHRLPAVAHPSDKQQIFSHVVNVSPQSDDPDRALALVVDPIKALQFQVPDGVAAPTQRIDRPQFGAQDRFTAQAVIAGSIAQRRGSGQLLAFVPEDVPRQQLNFVFCLPLAAVAEVVNAHTVMHSPLSAGQFAGYILWRKIPVPIIKLGTAFGMSEVDEDRRAINRSRRLVIARTAGHRYVGFYTQTQMHSMKAPTASVTKFEELTGTPHLGAFKTDYGVMVIPDLNRLLDL
jgi:chemotaxis signal transduction protein